MEPHLYAIGDVHGDVARLNELLRDAGLADGDEWSGGDSRLVLTGDLTDRGDKVLEVIVLVRKLQAQGAVESLMGNHDALILARAYEWRGERADPDCRDLFVMNGGKEREAKRLAEDADALAWMAARPLMLKIGETLFQHADSALYYHALGSTTDEVNEAGLKLAETGRGAWRVFYDMTDARDWDTSGLFAPRRAALNVEAHLARFGAKRVIHGHTRHVEPAPRVDLGGRAINVDGTLSAGYRSTPTRGFVADLGPLP